MTNGSGSNHANVGALAQVPGVIGNHSNGLLPGQIVGGSYLQKYTIPHLTPAQINLLVRMIPFFFFVEELSQIVVILRTISTRVKTASQVCFLYIT